MLKLKTNKLFYGKYPYKVILRNAGLNLFSLYGAIRLVKLLEGRELTINYNIDQVSLQDIAKFVIDCGKKIRTRVEGNRVSIFMYDKDIYNECIDRFKKVVVETHEPENEDTLQFLLENNKKVITTRLPHNRFRYKVYFKIMSLNEGDTIIKWAENNKRVRLNTNPKYSLKYGYNAYLLVEDQPTITMLTLLATNKINRIEEYVVRN